jgi:hypothetical protein
MPGWGHRDAEPRGWSAPSRGLSLSGSVMGESIGVAR